MQIDLNFYQGKKVLLTGHTGFKGAWLSKILIDAGAELTGYSRCTPKEHSLFDLAELALQMNSVSGDVRDLEHLKQVFAEVQPEIVIHMAAQPIVRESYKDPVATYDTNVMGTVNILECVRLNPCVKSFLNVTTDKVYENKEREAGYREDEPLDGYDPYSNSKSCSELVTHSYYKSFLQERDIAVSTARAGNVIGGGDFEADRIIPDCVRALEAGRPIRVRNPYSTRPYQHVLEPLMAYLLICEKQYEDKRLAGWYNVGPDDCDCVNTGDLVTLFCNTWGSGASWENLSEPNAPHEANFLKLDNHKIKETFGWRPTWHMQETMDRICAWTRVYFAGGNISAEMEKEIKEFLRG